MPVPPEVVTRMRAAATMDSGAFVTDVLFGVDPYAFRARLAEYDEFRTELAGRLLVNREDIELVGSGRLGFSLNPDHLLREFSAKSDLDLVVVSSEIFDAAWAEMLCQRSSNFPPG